MKRIVSETVGEFFCPTTDPDEIWQNHEHGVLQWILEHLPETGTFADIGANLGYFSRAVAAYRPQAEIIAAFEPSPLVLPYLRANTRDRRISVMPYIVSDTDSETDFYYRPHAEGNGRAYDPSAVDLNQWERSRVKTVLLDTVFERLDAAKIDVEGFELEVLRGAERLAASSTVFITEFHASYMAERGVYDEFKKYIERFEFLAGGYVDGGNAHGVIRLRASETAHTD